MVGGVGRGTEPHPFRVIAGQALSGLGWTAVAMLVGFAAKIVLTRKMPPQDMGIVVAAQAFVALALALAELGIPEAVVTYVGREASAGTAPKRTVHTALTITAAAALLATAVVVAALWGWFSATMSAEAWWTTLILTLALPLLAVGDVLGSAYRGINRLATKLIVIDVARPGLVVLALLLSPVALTRHAPYVAVLYAGGALVAAAALWTLFARESRWRDQGGTSARDLVRFGVPMAGASLIAGPLVSSAFPLMLSAGPGPTAVALFTIALSLQGLVYMPVAVLEQAAIPTWSRMAGHDTQANLAASYQQFAGLCFAAAASLGLVIIANDRALLTFVFGPAYDAARGALRWAIVATLFGALTGPNEGMLRALGLATAIFKSRTAAAAAGLVAGAILIPDYGLEGGVAAFAVTTVAINGLYAGVLYRVSGIHPVTRRHARTSLLALAGLLAATVVSEVYPLFAWIATHALALLVLAVNVPLLSALGDAGHAPAEDR